MTTFSDMFSSVLKKFAAASALAGLLLPCAAKSPEDFVGNTAAQGQPPAAQPAPGKAATAGTPAGQKPPKPAKTGALPATPAGPSDSAKSAPKAAKAGPAKSGAAAAAKPVLDTARIHGQYLDGDFDQAIHTLDVALKGRKPLSHTDSVFAFKHLGVMYAATPATREKGRYYMLQLISIEPTARILDMYASDMIYLIYRNIQEEYEKKHGKVAIAEPVDSAAAAPPAAEPEPVPAPVAAPAAPKRNRTLYWAAGGAAVAAGAAGLLFILLDDPQPKKRTILLRE
jgi:hypothetical protein